MNNLLRLTSTAAKIKKPDVLININEHKLQAIGIERYIDNDTFLVHLEMNVGQMTEIHDTEEYARERVVTILLAFGFDLEEVDVLVKSLIVK